MCEDTTLEAGTNSTKLADALQARPLAETHSFVQLSFLSFFHMPGTRLGQEDEWRTK